MSKNILDDAPPAVQKLFANLFRDMEQTSRANEEKRAQADPVKHRLTKVMRGTTDYYMADAGKDGRGSRVRFCRSTHRNVAGYFLLWRQTHMKRKVVRDQWDSTDSKAASMRWTRERADAFRKEMEAKKAQATD